jgi:hypothetical protein
MEKMSDGLRALENRSQFRFFEEFRVLYNSRIHLGVRSNTILSKLRLENLIGMFFRGVTDIALSIDSIPHK